MKDRLAGKLIYALKGAEIAKVGPQLLDVLCGGQGDVNTIPGGEPSARHPRIVVYSIKACDGFPGSTYHQPLWCLGKLEGQLEARLSDSVKTEAIKIIIDRVDPEIYASLVRILVIAEKMRAEVQIDWFTGENMEPVMLERLIRIPGARIE